MMMLANGALAALVVTLVAAPAFGLTPAGKCEAAKLTIAGKTALCQLKSYARGARTDRPVDLSKCDASFAGKWQQAEGRGGGACPSTADGTAVRAFLAQQAEELSTALAGGPLLDCAGRLETCSTDRDACGAALSTCTARAPGRRGATGQTTCFDTAGGAIPCAESGQDGALQHGLAAHFTDNGDGSITDLRTGLVWEKLSDDGTIHDKDNSYTWTQAVYDRIQLFNAANFAGHNDWRVPNANELQSLASYGAVNPAIDAIFTTDCTPGCAATSCSCTQSDSYWSSTTYQAVPADAWVVSFTVGSVGAMEKGAPLRARAVCGGF